METLYTIGQLARVSGVKASTIRYYERIGLLRPEGRTAGNYRLYGEEALQRLRFIRASQATGVYPRGYHRLTPAAQRHK